MEWVSVKWLLAHGWTTTDAWSQITLTPHCTDPMICRAAWVVNDSRAVDERQQLVSRIDRLMHCPSPSDPEKAKRVRVRVACWCARSVLDLLRDAETRTYALRAVESAEAWVRGEATSAACEDAAAAASATVLLAETADGFASAAVAAVGAADATSDDTDAGIEAAATAALKAALATVVTAHTETPRDPVRWLDDVLDQWEKAVVEEGCSADQPPVPDPE